MKRNLMQSTSLAIASRASHLQLPSWKFGSSSLSLVVLIADRLDSQSSGRGGSGSRHGGFKMRPPLATLMAASGPPRPEGFDESLVAAFRPPHPRLPFKTLVAASRPSPPFQALALQRGAFSLGPVFTKVFGGFWCPCYRSTPAPRTSLP